MLLSVIICTYNRDKYIYNTLEHIAKNDFDVNDYEIILVDNNSTDQTFEKCSQFQQKYTWVNYRYVKELNQGLSFARNRGIDESMGDYVVFLDDDAFVCQDFLKELHDYLLSYSDVVAWGGRIEPLFESGSNPIWWGSKWTRSWVSAIDLGDKVISFSKNTYPIGANMGFSRKCVKDVGYFNTALGRSKKNMIGGEEKDYFERVRRVSNNILYFPDLKVQHVIPESRTTLQYIDKMGEGIGVSEKLRTLSIGKGKFYKRLVGECVKWCATFVLWAWYMVKFETIKGNVLVRFRYHVTKGLLGK